MSSMNKQLEKQINALNFKFVRQKFGTDGLIRCYKQEDSTTTDLILNENMFVNFLRCAQTAYRELLKAEETDAYYVEFFGYHVPTKISLRGLCSVTNYFTAYIIRSLIEGNMLPKIEHSEHLNSIRITEADMTENQKLWLERLREAIYCTLTRYYAQIGKNGAQVWTREGYWFEGRELGRRYAHEIRLKFVTSILDCYEQNT